MEEFRTIDNPPICFYQRCNEWKLRAYPEYQRLMRFARDVHDSMVRLGNPPDCNFPPPQDQSEQRSTVVGVVPNANARTCPEVLGTSALLSQSSSLDPVDADMAEELSEAPGGGGNLAGAGEPRFEAVGCEVAAGGSGEEFEASGGNGESRVDLEITGGAVESVRGGGGAGVADNEAVASVGEVGAVCVLDGAPGGASNAVESHQSEMQSGSKPNEHGHVFVRGKKRSNRGFRFGLGLKDPKSFHRKRASPRFDEKGDPVLRKNRERRGRPRIGRSWAPVKRRRLVPPAPTGETSQGTVAVAETQSEAPMDHRAAPVAEMSHDEGPLEGGFPNAGNCDEAGGRSNPGVPTPENSSAPRPSIYMNSATATEFVQTILDLEGTVTEEFQDELVNKMKTFLGIA